jgi:isocitrate/isopropylmalate dehydrogenase
MLRSAALMLAHGLDEPVLAARLETAVDHALVAAPTPDLGGRATTSEFVEAVLGGLRP